MKTILVPTDFSEVAGHALRLAAEIARQSGADLELVHVLETTGMDAAPPEVLTSETSVAWLDQVEEGARTQLRGLVADFPQVTIRARVGRGAPFRHINQRALETKADLIVMGSEGSSGLDELLIGSNAERVVRFAVCPVLVVKNVLRLSDVRTVVFVTDLEEDLKEELPRFLSLWGLLNAQLHVLRVNTPQNWISTRHAERQLETFRRLIGEPFTFHLYCDATQEEGIHHFAADVDAHLLAMPTHARTGLSRLLAGGSVTENVLNHGRIALWTCRLEDE